MDACTHAPVIGTGHQRTCTEVARCSDDRDKPEDQFYVAVPYRSRPASPSRPESEIPLIVANPQRETASVAGVVEKVIGDHP